MSNEARAIILLVAVVLLAVEAVRARSFGWGGLTVAFFVPLWDAVKAA